MRKYETLRDYLRGAFCTLVWMGEPRGRLEQKMEAEAEAEASAQEQKTAVPIVETGAGDLCLWMLQDMLKHALVMYLVWSAVSVGWIVMNYACNFDNATFASIPGYLASCSRFVFLVSLPCHWTVWWWRIWREPYLVIRGYVTSRAYGVKVIRHFPPSYSLPLFWICLVWFIVGLLWYVRGLIAWVNHLTGG